MLKKNLFTEIQLLSFTAERYNPNKLKLICHLYNFYFTTDSPFENPPRGET